MSEIRPEVDHGRFAAEVKAYLDAHKMDMIDSDKLAIEAYPSPTDDAYPEMKSFAAQFERLFDYAETVTTGDKGEGFPHELVKSFEDELAKAQALVNGDQVFWDKVREVVLPLYKKTTFSRAQDGGVQVKEQSLPAQWADRWKAVKLFYDPVGLDVETTELRVNKQTGEKHRVRTVSKRTLPPGFVIKVL